MSNLVVGMLSRTVLSKGQIVIPKTLRDMIGINEGDEVNIEIENDRIILSKKQSAVDVFIEVSHQSKGRITMKDIKKELEAMYGGD